MVCKKHLRKEAGPMKENHNSNYRFTVGLDRSDKKSYFVVLDEHGEVFEGGRIATTAKAL